MVISRRVGAFSSAVWSSASKSSIPDAARVAKGPGEIAWTRMPLGPSSAAMERTALSSAALATPHDVVVLHHALAAVVGHRKQAATPRHQRLGQVRHAQK